MNQRFPIRFTEKSIVEPFLTEDEFH